MPRYHWDITDPLLCLEIIFGTGERFRTGEAAGPGSLEEQWKRGGAQKFPLGPPIRLISFFTPADKLADITDFVTWLIRLDLADELFLVNKLALASLIAQGPEEIQSLKDKLPTWILVYAVAGLEYLPEERIKSRTNDIATIAEKYEASSAHGFITDREPDGLF